jgi:hypothetical protein
MARGCKRRRESEAGERDLADLSDEVSTKVSRIEQGKSESTIACNRSHGKDVVEVIQSHQGTVTACLDSALDDQHARTDLLINQLIATIALRDSEGTLINISVIIHLTQKSWYDHRLWFKCRQLGGSGSRC